MTASSVSFPVRRRVSSRRARPAQQRQQRPRNCPRPGPLPAQDPVRQGRPRGQPRPRRRSVHRRRRGPPGSANIVDAQPGPEDPDGTTITLLDLPVDPPPNTHLATEPQPGAERSAGRHRHPAHQGDRRITGAGRRQPRRPSTTTSWSRSSRTPTPAQAARGQRPRHHPQQAGATPATTPSASRPGPPAGPRSRGPARRALASVQIGNVAAAPVGRVAVAAPAVDEGDPQALPTAVSAGLATAPGAHAPAMTRTTGSCWPRSRSCWPEEPRS